MLELLSTPGVLIHTPAVRVLLRQLAPGGVLPRHTHPGHTVLVTLTGGDLSLITPEDTRSLGAGEVARLHEHTPLELRAGPLGATFTVTLVSTAGP